MKIAVAQISTRAGDFAATTERVVELAARAVGEGAELLVLPSVAVVGQRVPDQGDLEGFGMDLYAMLGELSQRVACPCIIPIGTGVVSDNKPEVMLVQRDGFHPLRMLALVKEAENEGCVVFEQGGVQFGIAFDYDDFDLLEARDAKIDAILFFESAGFALDDPSSALGASLAENRFRDDAWAFDAWIVGVGPLGCYDLQVFTGSSFVISPRGELVACAPAFEEALILADVGQHSEEPVAEPLEPELYDRSLHLWEALTLGLRDHIEKSGNADVALALDGRLDSSVLAALATDALGPTRVHVVVDAAASEDGRRRAVEFARSLHVSLSEECDVSAPPDADAQLLCDLTQVRLASLARATGSLVLSSADKTACAVELDRVRCDSASLAPLGDVYRTDVMRLGRLRNTISPVIASESLRAYDVPAVEGIEEAGPTAEARLERIDVTLATYLEWGCSISDVVSRQGNRLLSEHIINTLHNNRVARATLAPCIVVSSCTLHEADAPFGMAWRDRVRSEDERMGRLALERAASKLDELMRGASGLGEGESSSVSTSDEDPVAAEIAALLEQLQEEFSEQMPKTTGGADADRQVGELLGLIRDIIQSGGGAPTAGDAPFGPLTWGSPFSEN